MRKNTTKTRVSTVERYVRKNKTELVPVRSSRKPRAGWSPTMEQRAGLEGRQVKCLIASEGHIWMCGYFDRLPPPVRARLAESAFNICPACMTEEADRAAARRNERKPSIAIYFAVIEAIEQQLGAVEQDG